MFLTLGVTLREQAAKGEKEAKIAAKRERQQRVRKILAGGG